MNQRAQQFRGRQGKIDNLNQQSILEKLSGLLVSVANLGLKVHQQQEAFGRLWPIARDADYRSLAMMNILKEKLGITEENVAQEVCRIAIEEFDAQEAGVDAAENLEKLPPEAKAEKGNFAVVNIKIFKDGKESVMDEVPRHQIQIGAGHTISEIDNALVGMSTGETKTLNITIKEKTSEAKVTLISLKKVKEEENKNEQPEASNQSGKEVSGADGEKTQG